MVHAGYLRCDSEKMTARDATRALSAARIAAGSLEVVESSRWACMNPGNGRVTFDTKPVALPDGSELRNGVTCTRESGPWHCEIAANRYAAVEFESAGVSRKIDFSLPTDLDVGTAKWLVRRAFELGPTVQAAQECSSAPADFSPLLSERWLPGVRAAYSDPATNLYASVDRFPDGRIAVIVADSMIFFEPPTDGGDWTFACWSIQVVVT